MEQLTGLLNGFLQTYGLVAIFAIMLLKEIGIPVPIPADLIMLGAAAGAAQGKFDAQGGFVITFLAILVPMVVGGAIQFALAKGPGRRLIYALGKYIGLTEARLDRAMGTVRKGGTAAVVVGLTTPGIRIATVPASGLANLGLLVFVPGLILGSAFFLAWHFALGYLGGLALALLSLPLPVLIGILVVVVVLGIIGWRLMRRMSKQRGAKQEISSGESFASWADAACPACIAIALVREQREAQMSTPLPVGGGKVA